MTGADPGEITRDWDWPKLGKEVFFAIGWAASASRWYARTEPKNVVEGLLRTAPEAVEGFWEDRDCCQRALRRVSSAGSVARAARASARVQRRALKHGMAMGRLTASSGTLQRMLESIVARRAADRRADPVRASEFLYEFVMSDDRAADAITLGLRVGALRRAALGEPGGSGESA